MNTMIGKKQLGLSIVELMIALLLASLLTAGLFQIFTANSETSRVNESSARVQESGRLASDIMARVIRNAAYRGCTDQARLNLMLKDDPDDGVDLSYFMTGVDVEFGVAAVNPWEALEGSDVLILGGVNTNAALRTTDHTPVNSATIFTGVNPTGSVSEGEILLISDCRSGDIFQATDVQNNAILANTGKGTPGNATKTQSEYPSGATVFRPQRNAFYVRENDGYRSLTLNPMKVSGSNVGTLDGHEELVGGVWDMRVRLGIDNSDPNDSIVDSWETSWPAGVSEEDVIAVQLSMLTRSPLDNVVDQPQSFCFPSWSDCKDSADPTKDDPAKLTTMPDRRLYRAFDITTGIRSRLQ